METPKVHHNYSLQSLTTFQVPVIATQFMEVNNLGELISAIQYAGDQPILILGGGSNLLFTQDYSGIVIQLKSLGYSKEKFETSSNLWKVTADAGMNWDDLVERTVSEGFGGLENLSLIPGTVGASPIQNIGAYGVELKDTLLSVQVLNRKDFSIHSLSVEDCKFGYRDSIFKNSEKNKWVILSVTFLLSQADNSYSVNTGYGNIQSALANKNILNPTPKDIREIVCEIRSSKLPDPKLIGNAGSFFKNPEVSEEIKNELIHQWPDLPVYLTANNNYKLAAGWLIEKAGWKGKWHGNARVHELQALVLTNPGNATGKEIYALALSIQKDIRDKFGVKLEMEVNIL